MTFDLIGTVSNYVIVMRATAVHYLPADNILYNNRVLAVHVHVRCLSHFYVSRQTLFSN